MVQKPIHGIRSAFSAQTCHADVTNMPNALADSIKAPGMKMKVI